LDILAIDKVSLDFELVNAENYLKTIQGFLDALNRAITESINLTQATLTNYKYYVNTGRTNVNTALTSVNAKKQAIAAQKALNQVNINTAKNILASAQDDLNLKKSSATIQQIAIQEAAVNQAKANVESQVAQIKYAEANVDNYKAQVAKTIIVSPIDGIVTKQGCKVGEIVSANTSVVSVISEAQFEIEANTPEADIAKVRIGDTARVTLDTYGSDVFFEAKVIKIDPAETILDGVATYKTTLQFVKEDERIMSGMTANVDVQTAKKENVIFVPQRSVLQKNGGYVVLVEGDDNKTEEKKVEIGLRGSDGNMEIISGLNENEKIIISGVAK
jgi:RND family efflux transporter MFP subunit